MQHWCSDFSMLKGPLPGGQYGNMKYRCVPSAEHRIEEISVRIHIAASRNCEDNPTIVGRGCVKTKKQ
jgi:hypothetical protein